MLSHQGCQCGCQHGVCATEFQYAIKVVCGELKPADNNPVAPGRYWTAVNIHNPENCKNANWRVKFGIVRLFGPRVSQWYGPFRLPPDGMIEFDCLIFRSIAGQLESPAPTFFKGYMVLESDVELDVVAVYSGSLSSHGTCNSFHTERVPARCVSVCEDLVLPLDTGIADWQTVSPDPVGPVVALSNLPTSWVSPSYGFTWVSQLASDSRDAGCTTRRYELCFELCDGFIPPSSPVPIYVVVDNSAEVSLNRSGSPGNVGTIPRSGFAAPTVLHIDPSLLHAGRNCLSIDVTSTEGPTGFALKGLLQVARGKCPCARLPLVTSEPERDRREADAEAFFEQLAGSDAPE